MFLIKENHFKDVITFCFCAELLITSCFFYTVECFRGQIEHRCCMQTRAAQLLFSLNKIAVAVDILEKD